MNKSNRKPEALIQLDGTIRHLRNSMARWNGLSRSLELQLLGILSHWGRHRLANADGIYPGISKMAQWGRCSERTAKRNFRQLVNWNVIEPIANESGGRGMATVFRVDIAALIRALGVMGLNASRQLIEKLRNAADLLTFKRSVKGDKKGVTVSPRKRINIRHSALQSKDAPISAEIFTGRRLGKLASAALAVAYGQIPAEYHGGVS